MQQDNISEILIVIYNALCSFLSRFTDVCCISELIKPRALGRALKFLLLRTVLSSSPPPGGALKLLLLRAVLSSSSSSRRCSQAPPPPCSLTP